jgi:hypothetical protein
LHSLIAGTYGRSGWSKSHTDIPGHIIHAMGTNISSFCIPQSPNIGFPMASKRHYSAIQYCFPDCNLDQEQLNGSVSWMAYRGRGSTTTRTTFQQNSYPNKCFLHPNKSSPSVI